MCADHIKQLKAEIERLGALSQPEGKAEAVAEDGYELAETVHGEIVRIVKRHNPLKEDIQPSGQLRAEIIEECAKVAEWSHMVPPDGGSPTEEERAVAEAAARNIRALAAQKKQPDWGDRPDGFDGPGGAE